MRNVLLLASLLMPQFVNAQDIQLIGGTVADPRDWPASPWVGNCSSTLIGERVLLTAAHCVSNGGSKSFTIGTTRYTGKCTHHTSYRSNQTADWALCLLSTPVTGVPLETIASADDVACDAGKKFLWTGYGCTRWGNGVDGKFRIGTATTTRCPSGSNYDTVTRGNVALCSGDSGGGGYVVAADGSRKVIGVNSRSNTIDLSYVSSTYAAPFQSWARTWGDTQGVKICGIHADAKGCSGETPDEPSCTAELNIADAAMNALKADRTLGNVGALEDATAALRSCLE